MKRCQWATKESQHNYHDTEWGVPSKNDNHLFEMITLEGAQAGLSWDTILKRREGYRKAFKNFDPKKVANFKEKDVLKLLDFEGIIRHRGKIESTINNAKVILEIQKEFGSLSNYIWGFVDNKPIKNKFKSMSELPVETEFSKNLSKDMKKKGFRFVGSTTMYAFMQAIGMTNDHEVGCFRYKEV